MKRILFTMLIANALIILSLSSCKKESFSPALGRGASPILGSYTIDLVADNWVNYGNEVYVSSFPGIMSQANPGGNPTVNVYLVVNGKETQINHSITFMGHELWATITRTDIKINYKSNAPTLPFASLNLKVVIG